MRWRSFVAVGDSFTEGMNDITEDGRMRGWADLVAQRLAAEQDEFHYANLAIRGRLFDRIVDEQVPQAVTMAPDLVSFAGGGNDVLRRSFDPHAMVSRFNEVIRLLRATGADVILFQWVDITGRLPGRRLILPRTMFLNRAVREVGERHGALVVNLWEDQEFQNPLLWSDDRLHMSTIGHRRVAAHVLRRLGVEPDPTWLDAPAPAPRLGWAQARAADLRWVQAHLVPWVKRRLAGTSSGDTISAKRPVLAPFTSEV